MNKITIFCDKVIEACWLAALVIAPLFMNFHSSVSFEPDKSTVVRSIALVMLAAFLVKRVSLSAAPEGGEPRPANAGRGVKSLLKQPLFAITLLLGLSYLVSTFLSVLPPSSWWGNYARGQGAYSLMGYFVIFAITALTLRERNQTRPTVRSYGRVERILVTIILTSIPVILYGFAQKLKLEVFNWDFSDRIASTMGNPIFLGSYLIMVIPLTIYLIIRSVKESGLAAPKAIFYIIILLAQVLCLVLTESRGPLLGLITAMFFFVVLSGLVFGRRYLSLGSYIAAALVLGFFLLLALPNTPFQGLKTSMGRLGQMLEAREGAAQVRLLIWEGVVKMVQSDSYRAVVGYGPEAMFVPYHKYCPAELITSENKITFPDRSHNEFFDTVITNGLIGALLYLALFGAIVFYGFNALGLVRSKAVLIGLLLLFGLAGLLIPIALGKTIFIAVGVPIGMVTGAGLYLLLCAVCPALCVILPERDDAPRSTLHDSSTLLLIALLSAFIGHFVEVQFGIDLTASRTYFYIYLSIFIAIFTQHIAPQVKGFFAVNKENAVSKQPSQPFSTMCWALIVILILSTMAFDFIYTQVSADNMEKVMRAMMMVALAWLSSAVLFYLLAKKFILASALSAGITGIFFIILTSFLPPLYIPTIPITIFFVWLFINVLVLAWALTRESPPQRGEARPTKLGGEIPNPATPFQVFSSILITVAVVFLIILTDLNPIKGDIIYKIGTGQEKEKQWEIALRYYEQATALSPDKGNYYGASARMCLEKYYAEKDPQKKRGWYDKCLDYLVKSIEYDSMNPTRQANMGRFYRVQGREAKDPDKRTANFTLAIKYYENACNLSSQHPALRNELGEVYHEMGRYDEAIKQYEKSLAISPDFSETHSHIGDAYLEKSTKPNGTGADKDNAARNYYEAVKIQARVMPDLREQNQEIMFERANVTVIKHYPQDYRAYYNLGRYYAGKGRRREAVELLEKALPLADEKTQAVISEMLEKLKTEK
ncbi:MAG: tetratricopeptide repeat protein [Planctomycetota bacterium]